MVVVALGRAVAVPVGSGGIGVTVGLGVDDGLAVIVCTTAVASRSGVGVRRAWGRLQDIIKDSKIRAIKRDFRMIFPSIIELLRRYYSLIVYFI
jgi:hypothetical protein